MSGYSQDDVKIRAQLAARYQEVKVGPGVSRYLLTLEDAFEILAEARRAALKTYRDNLLAAFNNPDWGQSDVVYIVGDEFEKVSKK